VLPRVLFVLGAVACAPVFAAVAWPDPAAETVQRFAKLAMAALAAALFA
jgi:hypothetical protein